MCVYKYVYIFLNYFQMKETSREQKKESPRFLCPCERATGEHLESWTASGAREKVDLPGAWRKHEVASAWETRRHTFPPNQRAQSRHSRCSAASRPAAVRTNRPQMSVTSVPLR